MARMPSRDLQPAELALPLHKSANIGKDNDVSISLAFSCVVSIQVQNAWSAWDELPSIGIPRLSVRSSWKSTQP